MSISRALLNIIVQSPQYTTPLPGSAAGPLWREMRISEPSFTHPPGAQLKEPPLQVPLTELPWRLMLHFHRPLSTIS